MIWLWVWFLRIELVSKAFKWGRHANEYHEYIFDKLQEIDEVAKGNQDVFLSEFKRVKQEILDKPDMLYKRYWQNLNNQ
jgi:hypothetical protein